MPKEKKPMKSITLKEGDRLKILPETDEFYFGCCDCGLVHRIKVEHLKDGTTLEFFRFEGE